MQGHPCACRENPAHPYRRLPRRGPSLRVQGEQSGRAPPRHACRAIPARAGRTSNEIAVETRREGHPCACRENLLLDTQCCVDGGPSLRVQGELIDTYIDPPPTRAIPARAGRTKGLCSPLAGPTGHPCACRENRLRRSSRLRQTGPSLRVQGEPPLSVQGVYATRAIPARAGRTLEAVRAMRPVTGHPCACRENLSPARATGTYVGPSLRVQGELGTTIRYVSPMRAIPARAGRTSGKA